MSQDEKKALGRILLEQRAIRPEDLERVLSQQRPGDPPLATKLIEEGLVTELEALRALSAQRGVPGIDLHQICIKLSDLSTIPRDIAQVHKLLPVLERPDRIFVAMANPEDKKILEELEFVTGKRVFAYIALEGLLKKTLNEAYDARDRGQSHYVGVACPADVLRRAGLDPAAFGRLEDTATPVAPVATPAPAPAAPAPAPAPAPPSQPQAQAAPAPPPAASAGGRPGTTRPQPPTPMGLRPPEPGKSNAPPALRAPSTLPRPPAPKVSIPREDGSGPTTPSNRPAPMFRNEPTNTENRFRPSVSGMAAVKNPVIVDERMQQASQAHFDEADFGDIAEELNLTVGGASAGGATTAPARTTAAEPAPDPEPQPTPVPDGAKKILVVDDEADIRRLIRRVLEERGHVVVEADRGRLALQLVKSESPDLVVLDAMLPEVHGFDIAKRIRNSSRYGHIPIVMVSAVYRGWRFAQDAKQSYGVDAYIEKPFRVQELVDVIEKALNARRVAADPEAMNASAENLLREGVEAYKAGDLEGATTLLLQGVQIDPLAYRLRYQLGLLYGKRGMLYDAIEQLERAVQLKANHFGSIKNLAILYQQAGFRNKALEAWERALGIAPDDETRQAIKEHIVSML
ncbi:MAG: response regulator [Polyangiaceae bacterium]